jgi:hypothetical protein
VASLALLAAAITALAASGGRTAYATAWTPAHCERVVLGTRSFGPTKPALCPQVSTGRGVASVELAGTRLLWLAYAGGNTREWSLFTATPSSPRPRLLRFVPRDVDQPSPIVLGPSDGTLLAYAVGESVVALRANGSRAFTWTAPANVTALAEHGSRIAVGLETGEVDVVAGGEVVRKTTFAGAPSAVGFGSTGLVAQLGRRLATAARTYPLPADAALEDVQGDVAAYVARRAAHLVRLSSGTDAVAGLADHVQLDGRRLVLAAGTRITVKAL